MIVTDTYQATERSGRLLAPCKYMNRVVQLTFIPHCYVFYVIHYLVTLPVGLLRSPFFLYPFTLLCLTLLFPPLHLIPLTLLLPPFTVVVRW